MAQKRSVAKTKRMPAQAAPPLKRGGAHARAAAKKTPGRAAQAAPRVQEGRSLALDLVGVGLIIVSVALIVTICIPTSAPLAAAINYGLAFSFGAGALLLPIALLVYALSLFFQGTTAVSIRFAAGLLCIFSACLSLMSLLGTPTTGTAPPFSYLVSSNFSLGHGGALGGLFTWLFLSAVGPAISLVIFLGCIVLGLVLCGLSISGFVTRLREKHQLKKELRAEQPTRRGILEALGFRGEAHHGAPSYAAGASRSSSEAADALGAAFRPSAAEGKTKRVAEPKTTFIGARKTSVLKRQPIQRQDVPDAMGASLFAETGPGAEARLGSIASSGATSDAQKTYHPELTSFVEPTGAIDMDTDTPSQTVETAKGAGAGLEDRDAASAAGASRKRGVQQKEKASPEAAHLPPMGILQSNPQSGLSCANEKDLQKTAERLQATLEEFGLKARVKGWVSGPLVTTFKIEMGEGERVNKITNLEDDIALALAAMSVRIFAPIPGTSLVGIEIPNAKRTNVCLGDVLPYADGGPLELAIGRDSEGHPRVIDLSKLPHLLVAGTTGSGKSVMLNAAIMSILMRATPEEVRLIMVDPKRVEFTCYMGLPHLYVPVVNEPKQAASALQWSVSEMERRLRIFEKAGARDIKSYNTLVEKGKLAEDTEKMPFFVVVIDELSDLMMVAGKEVESSIVRIAQLGRAAGIHLIVATQRPSADVVTGLIKANIDNRVALSVDNGTNSRIIIDQNGAEKLLGNGDMLLKLRDRKTPQRIQGCYVSDPEINKTVAFISEQTEADYHSEILSAILPAGPAGPGQAGAEEDDPLIWDAAEIVAKSRLGSTSGLQRTLRVGYARAGRIMDMLEAKGVVGPPDGSKPREVLVSLEELEELKQAAHADEFEESLV